MCAFRASCYSACLSWALVLTQGSHFVQDKLVSTHRLLKMSIIYQFKMNTHSISLAGLFYVDSEDGV